VRRRLWPLARVAVAIAVGLAISLIGFFVGAIAKRLG
jgi:hypothetical protein